MEVGERPPDLELRQRGLLFHLKHQREVTSSGVAIIGGCAKELTQTPRIQYPHIDGLHAVNTKGTLLGVNHSVIVNVCREEVRTSSLLLISYVLRW